MSCPFDVRGDGAGFVPVAGARPKLKSITCRREGSAVRRVAAGTVVVARAGATPGFLRSLHPRFELPSSAGAVLDKGPDSGSKKQSFVNKNPTRHPGGVFCWRAAKWGAMPARRQENQRPPHR